MLKVPKLLIRAAVTVSTPLAALGGRPTALTRRPMRLVLRYVQFKDRLVEGLESV